jgi:hypothetical protein
MKEATGGVEHWFSLCKFLSLIPSSGVKATASEGDKFCFFMKGF